MDSKPFVESLSFISSSTSWRLWHSGFGTLKVPSLVHFPVCQVKSDFELSPKILHHMRKKEEWKKQRRARKLRKLAETAREGESEQCNSKGVKESKGLTSFEKLRLSKIENGGNGTDVSQSGLQEKSSVLSKFEEEFARRVKGAVSLVKATKVANQEPVEKFREITEDLDLGFGFSVEALVDGSDAWLLAYGECEVNKDPEIYGRIATTSEEKTLLVTENSSRSNHIALDGNHGSKVSNMRRESVVDATLKSVPTATSLLMGDKSFVSSSGREDNQWGDHALSAGTRVVEFNRKGRSSNVVGISGEQVDVGRRDWWASEINMHDERRGNRSPAVPFTNYSFARITTIGSGSSYPKELIANNYLSESGEADTLFQEVDEDFSAEESETRHRRIRSRVPKNKDKDLGKLIRSRRKGEPLSRIMDVKSDDLSPHTQSILEVLREDVNDEVYRKPVDDTEQLEWLVNELAKVGTMRKFFLSRLMHGTRLKWTESRLLQLVQRLGERGNWRQAMQVVHWVHSREHYSHCHSRHVCTTLLSVLGKCRRPVEALNIFNAMREEFSTYPDMAAYHCIAVTLGQAGHLTELLELINSLKAGLKLKRINGYLARRGNWDGSLQPDIVVYNAVINACGSFKQWNGIHWVFQQMRDQGITPNSATFGLSIEVMVKSGQVATAWRFYERMERGGFLPNSLTFKALVVALGMAGEVDKAVEMVEDMEQRGVLECAGVYYALACTLCTAGRWPDALLQVEKLEKLPSKKPNVVTYTGLIRTCEKAGRWKDAISIFHHMQYKCAPNVGTYNIMIALYGRQRMFEEALKIFGGVKKGRLGDRRFYHINPRLKPDVYTYESMLGACAACEQWNYFRTVFQDMVFHRLELQCRRHAWLISPLVQAGQTDLITDMVRHLNRAGKAPNADVYRILLTSLHNSGNHNQVVDHLSCLLKQGIALEAQEWSTIFGTALQRLPLVDIERFICTRLAPEIHGDDKIVRYLVQCLISVQATRKAEKVVSLLGLEVGDLITCSKESLGDASYPSYKFGEYKEVEGSVHSKEKEIVGD